MKRWIPAVTLAIASVAAAAPVEVAQVRLGMTIHEFKAAYPHGVQSGISIAGAHSRRGSGAPAANFSEGRLDQFSAYFRSSDFDRIRRALLQRNPALKCGAKKPMAVCHDEEGTFVLARTGGMTMLLLQTHERAAAAARAFGELDETPNLRAAR